jgi:hypothetical protein
LEHGQPLTANPNYALLRFIKIVFPLEISLV